MKFGIIGGSGLYKMDGMSDVEEIALETPFGLPSDKYISGKLNGKDVVFLPRHGKGHRLLPSEINYRANIWGMKKLGVTHLIAVSAVGSLKEEIEPGHIVLPDQFIDRTKDRPSTFFGEGIAAHVQFGDPVTRQLVDEIAKAADVIGAKIHKGGTYVCMEGPLFSTKAESNMYRSWGASVIGMTNLQEAKLAREAELCFATIALSTDYDCWHESEEEVSVEAVIAVMTQNVATTQKILIKLLEDYKPLSNHAEHRALEYAIMTDRSLIPDITKKKLEVIAGKYM